MIKYGNIALTTTITLLTLYHLCLLLLVRLGGYIVNLSDFYSYRLIGKLTVSFQLQEFSLYKPSVDFSNNLCVYYESMKFTCLPHTGLLGGLEHLKIETRLIDEKIANALGECVT